MTSRRTVVTGASGFLGGALARRLVAEGEPLCLLLRASDDEQAVRAGLGGHEGQVVLRTVRWEDGRSVAQALSDLEIPVFYHLAGGRTLGLTSESLSANAMANVRPLEALIGSLATRPPGAFVHVSSGEVYGLQPPPCREEGPIEPTTGYGAAKAAAELLGLAAFRQARFPFVVARPAVVYGPRQAPVMFVPQMIDTLLAGEAFPMSPGDQVRDLVYVDDVVEALLTLARTAGAAGEIYNVGSGSGVRLRELAGMIQAALPSPGQVLMGALPYRDGEVMDYRLSIERIVGRTGWRPVTPLPAGLVRTVEAVFRQHGTSVPRTP